MQATVELVYASGNLGVVATVRLVPEKCIRIGTRDDVACSVYLVVCVTGVDNMQLKVV